MNSHVQAILIAAASLLSTSSYSVEISSGTSEYITMRNCSVVGVTGCDTITGVLYGSYGGLPGDSQSTAGLTVNGYGSGSGSVSLSGVIGAPILKASATSEAGKRINTNSIALQRYVYDGSISSIRTFGGTISYSQSSTGTYPIGTGNGISAYLEIFSLPTSTITIFPSSSANFNMLFGGFSRLPGFSSLGEAAFLDGNSTSNGLGSIGVTVNLNPGDALWVWALVQTPATNGGWIDSSHTFVTAWNETSNLTPSAVAVPEPKTLALLLSGIIFIAYVKKTHQSRRAN